MTSSSIDFKIKALGWVVGRWCTYNTAFSRWPYRNHYLSVFERLAASRKTPSAGGWPSSPSRIQARIMPLSEGRARRLKESKKRKVKDRGRAVWQAQNATHTVKGRQ
jgi:hypothetical protein